MVQVTAKSVTVLARTDMSDNGDPNIDERVSRLLDMRKEQLNLAEVAEVQVMRALWELRGSYRIEDMARWMGCSKQTIYNKWDKHGLKVQDDAKPARDSS